MKERKGKGKTIKHSAGCECENIKNIKMEYCEYIYILSVSLKINHLIFYVFPLPLFHLVVRLEQHLSIYYSFVFHLMNQ